MLIMSHMGLMSREMFDKQRLGSVEMWICDNYLTCVQISIRLVHRNTGHKPVSCLIYGKYNIIFVILKSTQENFCCLVDLIAST